MGKLRRRGQRWRIEYIDYRGRRVRESAGDRSEKEALELLAEREKAVQDRTHVPGQQRYKVKTLLDALLDDYQKEERRSIDTVEGRINNHILPWIGECPVQQVSIDLLEEFQGHLMEKGLARGTVNNCMAILRTAFRLAHKREKISRDLLPVFPMLRVNNAENGRYIAPALLYELLEHLPDWFAALAEFAYYSGRRQGELRSLRWDMISDGFITWTATKTNKPISVPLVGPLLEIVTRRREQAIHDGKLIPWVFHRKGRQLSVNDGRRPWETACRLCHVPGLRQHDLRVSAITNLRRAGNDRESCKKVSGHRSDQVFERYSIVEAEDMRKALESSFEFTTGEMQEKKIKYFS